MTKPEFVKSVSDKSDVPMKVVREVIKGIEETVIEGLQAEVDVPLIKGLVISSAVRSAHVCRNPRTGEPIEVPAKRVPKIKVGKALKAATE